MSTCTYDFNFINTYLSPPPIHKKDRNRFQLIDSKTLDTGLTFRCTRPCDISTSRSHTTRDSKRNLHGTWTIHPATTYLFYIATPLGRSLRNTTSKQAACPATSVLHFWARDLSHTNPRNDQLVEVPRSMPLLFRRDKTKESKQPNVCHDLAEKYTAVLIRILQWQGLFLIIRIWWLNMRFEIV